MGLGTGLDWEARGLRRPLCGTRAADGFLGNLLRLLAARGPYSRGGEPGDPMTSDEQLEEARQARGPLMAISNEMTRIYKDQFGRGPTRVRTGWSGDDTLVVTLEDTFTPAERSLQKMGQDQRLRDTRLFFQYASIKDFCEPVERLTGRRVRGFVSGIDTHVDIALELFVLHPVDYEGPGRADTSDGEF